MAWNSESSLSLSLFVSLAEGKDCSTDVFCALCFLTSELQKKTSPMLFCDLTVSCAIKDPMELQITPYILCCFVI